MDVHTIETEHYFCYNIPVVIVFNETEVDVHEGGDRLLLCSFQQLAFLITIKCVLFIRFRN